jgi:hypothetical protein
VSEERFDKIRFYLKTGTYPNGSDRAEKSRLRSAATHYRLVPNDTGDGEEDKLMLKGKEVISDPHKQYEIARNMHAQGHGGINKTTASIAEKYHWVRIKETVSAAIRNCTECKEPSPKAQQSYNKERRTPANEQSGASRSGRASQDGMNQVVAGADQPQHNSVPMAPMQFPTDYDMPVDPQIMQSMQHQQWGTGDGHHERMAIDGQHNPKYAGEDVGATLREQLEAQILREDEQAYARSQNR